jgi:translocation and assembly module TamB
VFGIEVADWRLPLDFSFIPGDGGQLDIRDTSAQVARGRALGRASLTWGYGTRLDGSLRFYDVAVRNLFGPQSEVRSYASGQLSGTLDFSSDDLRSPEDLNATLTARLSQSQALGLPVLQQTIPFLGLVGGAESTQFQSGDLRGRLSRGVFRIERVTLSSPAMQLIVEGNVTLAGLLDLEVTAATGGSFCNSRVLQLLGLRLPAIGPLPLTLIVDASAFLANRVVHLRVTGTYRNPVVQVVPTALLTQEAVRFFISRAGLPVGL